MLESNPDYCQLATTSDCPNNCQGPHHVDYIQDLDPNASCYNGQWNGGCYIKTGGSLDILCIILTHLYDRQLIEYDAILIALYILMSFS